MVVNIIIRSQASILKSIESFSPIDGISFSEISETEIIKPNHDEVLFYLIPHGEFLNEDQKNNLSNLKLLHIGSKTNISLIEKFNGVKNIGIQRHLHSQEESSGDNMYLSEIKNKINLTEPLIRSAEVIFFDLNVLRKSEVSNNAFAGPSGLFSEETTQMFRYAGMSENNKIVIINNFQPELSDLVAQFIWYYSEAVSSRTPDHPYFENTVHEYVVDLHSIDKSVSFFKSKISGRWWIKVPEITENKWMPCNYEDYLDACQDEINEMLLDAIVQA